MPKDDFLKSVKKGFKGTKKEVKEERVSTKPIRGGKKGGKIPGFMKEMAEEREGKAEKMTRLMKKGYRKGYRVPKRGSGRTRSSGR